MGHPVFNAGKTALITGGASGIGLAIAELCIQHGMKVTLADNNAELLARAKQTLTASTASTTSTIATHALDVSNLDAWTALHGSLASSPDLLVLNAGIGTNGTWDNAAYFHTVMATNVFGVVHGLATFLPGMRDAAAAAAAAAAATAAPAADATDNKTPAPASQLENHHLPANAIVITGSKQGITNPPGNAAYNASKSAVKTLAEHLSFDLRGTPTTVHLLVPGWTFTGLSGGAPGSGRAKPDAAWAPEQVARFLETAMASRTFYVLCPDNMVDLAMDKSRMMWSVGDVVHGRQPLSRWREETKAEAEEWMRREREKY